MRHQLAYNKGSVKANDGAYKLFIPTVFRFFLKPISRPFDSKELDEGRQEQSRSTECEYPEPEKATLVVVELRMSAGTFPSCLKTARIKP